MTIHADPHPLAGQTVIIGDNVTDPVQGTVVPGAEYIIEDWWDRVSGAPWGDCQGNFAAMHYGLRAGMNGVPPDDEVVYGKIGTFGHLVHMSEIKAPAAGRS